MTYNAFFDDNIPAPVIKNVYSIRFHNKESNETMSITEITVNK